MHIIIDSGRNRKHDKAAEPLVLGPLREGSYQGSTLHTSYIFSIEPQTTLLWAIQNSDKYPTFRYRGGPVGGLNN